MIPELFKIGPFTVYSYGLMLGLSFIVSSYILAREFERKKLDQNFATEITLFSIIFGIMGSKLFHLLENWKQFVDDPIGMAFSPGGLTYFGGFLLASLMIFLYVRYKKIPFLFIADSASGPLAIAYGIGRIGCHLSGDGDYGLPTNWFVGTNYQNGIVKPSQLFAGSDIAKAFPDGIVPDNTPLHPTPMYEFFIMLIIFAMLWNLRKKGWVDGKLFMVYLILAGLERLFVEFIRLNPKLFIGLSEAQLIAVGLIVAGSAGLFILNKKGTNYTPPPEYAPKNKKKS